MLTEPLPNSLDVRKAAVRGVTVSGLVDPSDLKRFSQLLAADTGNIEVALVFSRDEENRHLIKVSVTAHISVACQRCLEPMHTHLETDNVLAIVWDDDSARQLPRYLDPMIVADGPCNLWELVEEELILGMPAFSYHEAQDCNEILAGLSQPPQSKDEEGGKPNPFNVLAQMKPGNKH